MSDIDLRGFSQYRSPFADAYPGSSHDHRDWYRHCLAWTVTGDEQSKEYMLNFVTAVDPPSDNSDFGIWMKTESIGHNFNSFEYRRDLVMLLYSILIAALVVVGVVVIHLVFP